MVPYDHEQQGEDYIDVMSGNSNVAHESKLRITEVMSRNSTVRSIMSSQERIIEVMSKKVL